MEAIAGLRCAQDQSRAGAQVYCIQLDLIRDLRHGTSSGAFHKVRLQPAPIRKLQATRQRELSSFALGAGAWEIFLAGSEQAQQRRAQLQGPPTRQGAARLALLGKIVQKDRK